MNNRLLMDEIDVDVIQEFNSKKGNINNYSYKKTNKYNTILTMTNYHQKNKGKFTRKIKKEDLKSDKKNENKSDKQKFTKQKYNLKNKEKY